MKLTIPQLVKLEKVVSKNGIVQLADIEKSFDFEIQEFNPGNLQGFLLVSDENQILITKNHTKNFLYDYVLNLRTGEEFDEIFIVENIHQTIWQKHPLKQTQTIQITEEYLNSIRNSWNRFGIIPENAESNTPGLRKPQIGAHHAVLAHWTVSHEDATIVMPTGTGKTETMISILLSERCKKLLVVVPTNALRDQLADKFLTLGIFKSCRLINSEADFPVVGKVKKKFQTIDEVDDFFGQCNVVISTMKAVSETPIEIQNRIAQNVSHLFIDEAHHIAANTWKEFKKKFKNSKTLQFTATPYRNDGKLVDGKIIYDYPLKKAQEEEYFKPIQFHPVNEYNPSKWDLSIAQKAIELLRQDIGENKDHLLMARVKEIKRANEVHSIYQELAPDLNPVQIHTGIKGAERECIRNKILRKEAKIIVCVDMLGEGFDLPELKIAAFHDIKKSLAVTLQLAGRFTRTKPNLGDAKFVANLGNIEVEDSLRELYSQDANWNSLLPGISSQQNRSQVELWEFLNGFKKFPEELALQNISTALSTVVFKVDATTWNPKNYEKGIQGIESYEQVYSDINTTEKTLVIVAGKKSQIIWGDIKDLFNLQWEIFIIHWNTELNLLFIHSSNKGSLYEKLAEAIIPGAEIINGGNVFRCFSNINRLKLHNVGLKEQLAKLVRFIMRVGPDIEAALSESTKENTIKSNVFGVGYENGEKTSIGCSYKGRIWSHRSGNIKELTSWFAETGKKLIDDRINPEIVLDGTLLPKPIKIRPNEIPVYIEWNEFIYQFPEEKFSIVKGNSYINLSETELVLADNNAEGHIKIKIVGENIEVQLELEIFETNGNGNFRFNNLSQELYEVEYGKSKVNLRTFLYENPPIIWFLNGASLEGNSYTELKSEIIPFPKEKLITWDWAGVNIRKESQGVEKADDSIQRHVISYLLQKDFDLIFDDDGSGEAADIVAVREEDTRFIVHFIHCKYSSEISPGGRIKDLYEVCGQAQKSIHWKSRKPSELFKHLLKREALRGSRIERGNKNLIIEYQEKSRTQKPFDLEIIIVQPGLSVEKATNSQLQLLAVTENHLIETYRIPFSIICSK